jgi:hypothetical protein
LGGTGRSCTVDYYLAGQENEKTHRLSLSSKWFCNEVNEISDLHGAKN